MGNIIASVRVRAFPPVLAPAGGLAMGEFESDFESLLLDLFWGLISPDRKEYQLQSEPDVVSNIMDWAA